MKDPRDEVIGTVNRCVYVESDSWEAERLNKALDTVEADALHRAVDKLLDLHMHTMLRHGPEVASGLVLAAKEIDPYERTAVGPAGSGRRFDECTTFCEGRVHYHPKEN